LERKKKMTMTEFFSKKAQFGHFEDRRSRSEAVTRGQKDAPMSYHVYSATI